MPRPSSASDREATLRLVAAVAVAVLLSFLAWEGVEEAVAPERVATVHYARGVSTSVLAAAVAGWLSRRDHRKRAAGLEAEVTRRTREAESARALLQVVVDTTPAALLVVDRDRRVVQANRTAEQVHGGPLVGRHCFEIRSGRDERCADCARWPEVPVSARVLPCPSPDPRTGEVLAAEGHPLSLPDGREYMLIVERVMTEQRKLQVRLVHQEKMAAFGLLAAGIAHEMGNPLSSMEAQLQLLEPDRLSPEVASVVSVVRQQVQRLGRTVRELVDFARRRRDEAALVSLQAVVTDSLRLLRHDKRMRNVRVIEEYSPDAPPVHAVEDHLMQVVLNLLLNALDAMPDGGALRVEVRGVGGRVALRVHDTGVGMDRAVLARACEPLFTTKGPGQGTGLGLSVSQDILRAAGGGLELHSAPGRGTTAVVTLPAAGAESAAAETGSGGRVAAREEVA